MRRQRVASWQGEGEGEGGSRGSAGVSTIYEPSARTLGRNPFMAFGERFIAPLLPLRKKSEKGGKKRRKKGGKKGGKKLPRRALKCCQALAKPGTLQPPHPFPPCPVRPCPLYAQLLLKLKFILGQQSRRGCGCGYGCGCGCGCGWGWACR